MKKLYILCGLPGSGKSTWARKMVEGGYALCVSKDAIRSMLFGGKYKYDHNIEPMVKDISQANIRYLLINANVDVIIDETHITKQKRSHFIKFAEALKVKPIIVHFTETKSCLDNRMKEPRGYDRKKWHMVISGMLKDFEWPTEKECDVVRITKEDLDFWDNDDSKCVKPSNDK